MMKQIIRYCFIWVIFFSGCKKQGSAPVILPQISINNISQERINSTSTFQFKVSLDKASANQVQVHYSTMDGTAIQGIDYNSKTGTISFLPNQLEATIDITVTGDSTRKEDQQFFIQLDQPQNATLQISKGTGEIINRNGTYFPVSNVGYSTPNNYPGYTLVWNDEFSSTTISNANWTFELGNNNGWGNNELEYYTDRPQNVFVSQGNLIIEARKESFNGFNYTSTRMITKGKKIFTYGRIDIRAKMPKGQGIWPALWMLGNNIGQVGWPACGEIDIMEFLGHEPNKIHGTLHWGPNFASHIYQGNSYTSTTGGFDEKFNVFSLLWTSTEIKVLVNDQVYFTKPFSTITGPNPFINNFFFVFNVAVGGNWPGSPNSSTQFPQRMVVDYIRVFQ